MYIPDFIIKCEGRWQVPAIYNPRNTHYGILRTGMNSCRVQW
jgi:hypothetical protein